MTLWHIQTHAYPSVSLNDLSGFLWVLSEVKLPASCRVCSDYALGVFWEHLLLVLLMLGNLSLLLAGGAFCGCHSPVMHYAVSNVCSKTI